MTDKLRAAAVEALEAMLDVQDMMNTSDWFNERVEALRQALEEPPNSSTDVVEPEPEEPLTLEEQREAQQQLENHLDAVYQRNDQAFLAQAQLGQPDATKWLDEIRSDEPNLLNQTCCGCNKSGGYALYCGWCWNKGDDNTAEEAHNAYKKEENK